MAPRVVDQRGNDLLDLGQRVNARVPPIVVPMTRTCGNRCARTAELMPSAAISTSASTVWPSSRITVTFESGLDR